MPTEEEKRQAIGRIVGSLNGGRTAEKETERAQKQHAAWRQSWTELERSPVKEVDDGLIASQDVNKIVYGDCGRL